MGVAGAPHGPSAIGSGDPHSIRRVGLCECAITSDNFPLSLPIPASHAAGQGGYQPSTLLQHAIRRYAAAAHARNTQRAYAGDLAAFVAWGGTLPCPPPMLAAFIADHAHCWSPPTIARRIAGIRWAHAQAGHADPANALLVRDVLRGVRRLHGRPPRRVVPVVREALHALALTLQGVQGRRDLALLLLGFAAALRRSELVALDVGDITWHASGLLLHIRRSKTDVANAGRTIAVPTGNAPACPVQAVQRWLASARLEEGPLFRAVNKAGRVSQQRLSAQSVALIIKRRATPSVGAVSGHSLRAGFATSAAQAQVPLHRIQQQTGHRSLPMLVRYIREATVVVASQTLL